MSNEGRERVEIRAVASELGIREGHAERLVKTAREESKTKVPLRGDKLLEACKGIMKREGDR